MDLHGTETHYQRQTHHLQKSSTTIKPGVALHMSLHSSISVKDVAALQS
jgi:hypothetical protein